MTIEFFEILEKDTGFCTALGRVVLFAGALETELRRYLELCGHSIQVRRSTLEKLISILQREKLLSKNMEIILIELKEQRNYLSHNIYNLLSGEIREELLAVDNLEDLDVIYYTNKATETAANLKAIAEIVRRRTNDISNKRNEHVNDLLL